ncbi:MAG: hypothetical protein COA96_10135 [SAR86 cluster bacterium]|uniref:Uncharacterized protein n=1 Tax=SAR86 cluster bacterium TaxID=2030880 RepID=A0A2A5AXR6_9GAMM|nr:MAG: hypothetical protein COA96_10135 [SAR86 cluster bacterium]
MAILEIQGKRVEVDDSFKDLSPEEQAATVDEIAASMGITGESTTQRLLGQFNKSAAEGFGGLVDFINPFDKPNVIAGFEIPSTGSAAEGLKSAFRGIGAAVADRPAEGIAENLAAGSGLAASMFAPGAGAIKGLKGVGGVVGGVADDAIRAMLTKAGLVSEIAAGGIAEAGAEIAEQRGASPLVQDLVRIAAPVGVLATVPAAARGVAALAKKTPLGAAVRVGARMAGEVKRSLAPQTEGGAEAIAAERVRQLVGGEKRAAKLAKKIDPDSRLKLTAAQQVEDPVLLGLERQARIEDPLVRERLDARQTASREAAGEAIAGLGGDVKTGQTIFQKRIAKVSDRMQTKIDDALKIADVGVEASGPRASETQASLNSVERIKTALGEELATEKALWEAVPKTDVVPVRVARETALDLIQNTPRAQQGDIPVAARNLLAAEGGFGEAETVSELHGLYSSLRQSAREASSGVAPNANKARIANQIADGIMMDLGAVNADTVLGKSINEARAFSRSLHETFDQGAVGRILKRNLQGGETIAGEAALRSTVRPGPAGVAADISIRGAAPDAQGDIAEFLRGQFLDSAFDASGKFTAKNADRWLRSNRELLTRHPELKGELQRSLTSRKNADIFAARTAARQALIENDSASARFALAPEEKAAKQILASSDPVAEAKAVMASARKDETEFAVDAVKGAFTEHLIAGGTSKSGVLSGDKLANIMTDKKLIGAMKQIFSPDEFKRLKDITREISKVDPKKITSVDAVLDTPANKILEFVVTTIAARRGAALGAGTSGASLKTAATASASAKAALKSLTNSRARQVLIDAIEDPALMKALLATPEQFAIDPVIRNKLAPYLAGGAATIGRTDEQAVDEQPANTNVDLQSQLRQRFGQ